VHDAAIQDVVGRGAALDAVAHDGVMRVARPEGEGPAARDVDIVRMPVGPTVHGELRALDDDVTLRAAAGEHAGVVVVKVAVADGQTDAFAANAGAIAMRAARARELRMLDRHVAALDDPDSLVLGEAIVRVEVGAAADATNRQITLRPYRHVVIVDSGFDLDDIAVSGDLGGCARRPQRLARPYAQRQR